MEPKALDHLKLVAGTQVSVHPAYVGPLPGQRDISPEHCEKGRAHCAAIRAKFADLRNSQKASRRTATAKYVGAVS